MRKRIWVYVAGVATIAVLAAVAFAAIAHSTQEGPPDWLVTQAQQVAVNNQDPAPSSAACCLTTRRKAAAAMGEPGQPFEDVPVYLVVLTGHFTDEKASTPGGPAPQGTILAYTADATSHAILDLGLTDGPLDTKSVGQMASFSVPAFSPTPAAQATPSPVATHPLPSGLTPYAGPDSRRLRIVAARWAVELKGGGDTKVVIIPTTLARASSVFGPVIAGQGARRSFALLASGSFTTPGGNPCHFIAAEVDAKTLNILAETWAPGGWNIGSLGRAYSLKLW